MHKYSQTDRNGLTPLVVALDLGTSSVRAVAFDRQGQEYPAGKAMRPTSLQIDPDGSVTLDPLLLLRKTVECLDDLLQHLANERVDIRGVGISTLASSLLGIDRHHQPVTPLILYADTRPAEQTLWLRQNLDEKYYHDRTGCHFHSSYWPARFLWISTVHPGWLDRAHRWITLGEFLALQLFGEAILSYSAASWTGLLNRRTLAWESELLDILPVDASQFGILGDIHQSQSHLRPEYVQRWPALSRAVWFPAVGDGAAANIGSGCLDPSRMAVTIGTSSALRVTLPFSPETVPFGLFCYRVDSRRVLLGGALSQGGNVRDWLRQVLQLPIKENIEAELRLLPPGSNGLLFLPALSGERSLSWNEQARGVLSGLSLSTRPVEILRAGMEGVAMGLGLLDDTVSSTLPAAPQVVGSGSALLHSPAWLEILSNVLGRPVYPSQVSETSARGAALLAWEALGEVDDLDAVPVFLGEPSLPNPSHYALYQNLSKKIQNVFTK